MSFGTPRGRVDEKRTLMRAFLRQIDFLWVVPNGGQDGLEVRLAGQGRYRGAPASGADADSSFHDHDEAGDTRFTKRRRTAEGDASSFSMVAGARSAPEEKTWWRVLGREVPFRWDFKRGRGHRNGSRPRRPQGWVIIGSGEVAGS